MLHTLPRFRRVLLLLSLATLIAPTVVRADETGTESEEPPPLPFGVVNAASVERLLTEVQYVFDVAERPELMETVESLLGNIKNLEGVDRTKPFGAMFFLDAGLPPTPFPVMYIPVEDEQKLLDTLTFGDNLWKKSGTDETRYDQISDPKMHLKFDQGYAFICRRGDWVLDEVLPEPIAYNEVLTGRYDLAAALRIGSIPEGIRQVFAGFLRASSEAELQQRDNEPVAAYRMRRANGIRTLDFLEQLLTEGDQVTLGLDASIDARSAVLELGFDAQPNTEFADYLTDVSGTQSLFHALADDTQPLSIAMTFKLNERDQTAYREMVDVGREEALRELEANEPTIPLGAVANLFDAVDATLADGQMDVMFQFVAPEADRFVLLGVARIVGAQTAGAALKDLLAAIQQRSDNDAVIELNAATYHGVVFHRIEGANPSDTDLRLYNGVPSVLLGASDQAVWVAVGNDPLPELKHAIDVVRESAAKATPPASGSPFRITARMNRWMQLQPPEEAGRNRDLFENAFAFEDDDALRLEVRPTEHGARMRLSFDESFLRLIGMAVGRGIDDEARRQAERAAERDAEAAQEESAVPADEAP